MVGVIVGLGAGITSGCCIGEFIQALLSSLESKH